MPPALLRRRLLHITVAVAGVTVVIVAGAAIALASYDWNGARPWINQRIGAAIDRPFAIRGPLTLTWRQPGSAADRTWRDYLPLPHLVARDVHIGQPASIQAGGERSEERRVGKECPV